MKLFHISVISIIIYGISGLVPEACNDWETKEKHNVGANWVSKTQCEGYVCKLVPIPEARNREFPIAVKKVCSEIKAKKNCTLVPQDLTVEFPKCCPILVCIDKNVVKIEKSTDVIPKTQP
ncbi:uncharacterized protein LOC123293966 [Chrysoperla carnea]|uniref:uncharacterized protein LOC123293966 n=1 Tax=Chrysoperla carnea TaxID=189513 RepID=UPI001D05F17F|nr:uncharacterized protein LOC123293966 [Chrysoperla carnea]